MEVGTGQPASGVAGSGLELWVGPEASYVRVGDRVTDEQALSGFSVRPGDLERLASLGARRVRFPLLWEREAQDQEWAKVALPHLKRLGVQPILGLVHHGGGPLPGGLLDPGFAEGLAAHAGRVARRFPWVDAYTPVNEPLTTARFSALYGVWYPHASDDRAFVRALFNELRGTVLSMQAIREVNPAARLVQTEDMGRVYGTPALAEQVEYENLRRWLSFDLLCGRVDEQHGLWGYLLWAGASESEVRWFAEHPCPPDVIGLNVYPTSERYLDERLDRYPASSHGGNGRVAYADVEAIRVRNEPAGIFYERLMEAHERYGRPLALTEVHLGCTREEQLRWLNSGWNDALRARAAGAEVLGMTVWSAFGSYEWNSLLTRQEGHYEPGLWDVSSELPRETALAGLARALGHGEPTDHFPVLTGPGWWERAERRHLGEGPLTAREPEGPAVEVADGPLNELLEQICRVRGLPTTRDPAAGPPWARLEASSPSVLNLHWLGQGTLTVQARILSRKHLEAALDLLLDGETGLWVWEGRRFMPMDEKHSGRQANIPFNSVH